MWRVSLLLVAAFVSLAGTLARAEDAADWQFTLRFTSDARQEPFSGRVYVLLSKAAREPRFGPDWFTPEVFCSQDVTNWMPDRPLVISSLKPVESLLSYPQSFSKLDLKGFRAQAVLRFNTTEREIGKGPGNGFSQVVQIQQTGAQLELVVDRVIPPRKFLETHWSKQLRVKSELLSKFYGRDVFQNAAVVLPASYYEQPERRYPVIYQIPGFGGDHYGTVLTEPIRETNPGGVEFLRVVLDPSCPLGHHVFADSANNGPRGRCLVDEFIPEFDRQFRSVAKPSGRFVTGHSSGGWSSLWLQVTYPDHFGGVWSTAPDPVDFRDFQRIDLYRTGENMYVDASGQKRPLARVGGKVMLQYQGFADMEWTLGPGGQLHSFEACFSPRGSDGKPLLIWDRKTGVVKTDVAKTWEQYDIRLVLERNWKQLEPKLRGKLFVAMGDQDTFYLEGATLLLKKSLADLGSDAVVEIHAGKDHSNIVTPEYRNRVRTAMAQRFLDLNP